MKPQAGIPTLVVSAVSAFLLWPLARLAVADDGKEAVKLPFIVSDQLTKDDPLDVDRKTHYKVHPLTMTAGQTYDIVMMRTANTFDCFLILRKLDGQILAQHDSRGTLLKTAVITFNAPQTETYQVIATTSVPNQTGRYALVVDKARALSKWQAQANQVPPANNRAPPQFTPGPDAARPSWYVGLYGWLVIPLIMTPFVIYLAVQALRRGYSFFFWFGAGLLAINPIMPLVLLGLLPDRKRQKWRQQELERLRDRLRKRPAPLEARKMAASTIDSPTPVHVPTPRERSLGDEDTRL